MQPLAPVTQMNNIHSKTPGDEASCITQQSDQTKDSANPEVIWTVKLFILLACPHKAPGIKASMKKACIIFRSLMAYKITYQHSLIKGSHVYTLFFRFVW